MIFPHFAVSALTSAASSAGVEGFGSAPESRSLLR
jgi:hypothetical protein